MLPPRSVICALPFRRPDRDISDLIPSEESATVWLWAWPDLLGWSKPITWLFSPVVGRRVYPGDLWGPDSEGELVIVETKINRGRATQDPFEDFVGFCDRQAELAEGPSISANRLFPHWEDLYRQEMKSISACDGEIRRGIRLKGTYPGVLPYSYHRYTLSDWPKLYAELIAPRLVAPAYKQAVQSALELRRVRDNPTPCFFGVIAAVRQRISYLSSKGLAHANQLIAEVGAQRVHLRIFEVKKLQNEMQIEASSPRISLEQLSS